VLSTLEQAPVIEELRDEEGFLLDSVTLKRKNRENTLIVSKMDAKATKAMKRAKDALEKAMAEFNSHKGRIPMPECRHDKGEGFNQDIAVSAIDIIVGGKTLLEDASLRFVKGRKYGLVGRNGIGKTCLINAISRGEIEGFPTDVHVLQVEQEVESDNITVLQHILNCDVERTALLAELEKLVDQDPENLSDDQNEERNARVGEINQKLE